MELPINRKWTSRYAKRKVRPDSESLRRGEHNAPISNAHRRRPYGNLGDRPLGGRYVRYGISTGVGVCTWRLAETDRAGASEPTHKILLHARLCSYPLLLYPSGVTCYTYLADMYMYDICPLDVPGALSLKVQGGSGNKRTEQEKHAVLILLFV